MGEVVGRDASILRGRGRTEKLIEKMQGLCLGLNDVDDDIMRKRCRYGASDIFTLGIDKSLKTVVMHRFLFCDPEDLPFLQLS